MSLNKSTNSMQHYMAKKSLFKTNNNKMNATSYPTHTSKISPSTQYQKPKINWNIRDSLINKSLQDKNQYYQRQSYNVQELQGIEQTLNKKQELTKTTFQKPIKSSHYQKKYYFASTMQPRINQNRYQEDKIKEPIAIDQVSLNPNKFQKEEPLQEDLIPSNVAQIITTTPKLEQKQQPHPTQQKQKMNILLNNQEFEAIKQVHQQDNSFPIAQSHNTLNVQSSVPKHAIKMNRTESHELNESFGKSTPKSNIINSFEVEQDPGRWKSFQKTSRIMKNQANTIIRKPESTFQRMIPVQSIAISSLIPINTGQQTVNHLANSQEFINLNDKDSFFNSTKRDTNRYIQKIKGQLKQTYTSLSNIQTEIDSLVQKNLQLECQKLKNGLYKSIDQSIKQFKEIQRKKLSTAKFSYMADLYEIKCNIDLRVQELQDFQLTLNHDTKWRSVVGDLLTPDYQSTINFLLSKSEQIQGDSISYTNQFLGDYNNQMYTQVQQPLKKQMKIAIESLFLMFMATKNRGKSPFKAENIKNVDENPNVWVLESKYR